MVSNGLFALQYLSLSSQPIFRIEAEGYEPYLSGPIAVSTKNLQVRLKHGVGPNGVVLLPGGEPAKGATVVYAASRDSFSFGDKAIGPNGIRETNGRIFQLTGKAGAFAFQPRTEGRTIYVSHPGGWAEEDVSHGGNDLKLKLRYGPRWLEHWFSAMAHPTSATFWKSDFDRTLWLAIPFSSFSAPAQPISMGGSSSKGCPRANFFSNDV